MVADAGYGVSTPFRLGLEERGLSYVLALNGKEVAHPELPDQRQRVGVCTGRCSRRCSSGRWWCGKNQSACCHTSASAIASS